MSSAEKYIILLALSQLVANQEIMMRMLVSNMARDYEDRENIKACLANSEIVRQSVERLKDMIS
jgi:hypothetical protein